MADSAVYKQKARAFEQREDWKRAIEAYEAAIEADRNEGADVEPSLHNRVGDLYRRIGDVAKAVHHYEAAVDGHLSAGFYNNGIALCNKILRSMPNRHSIYLKLGKIGAAKGFLSDARKHFLEYAERMQRANQLDEAFSALIEFADISPDPEIRMMIADQLLDHEETDHAVEQLRLAWRDLSAEGRDEDARAVRDRIIQVAPDQDPEVVPPEEGTANVGDTVGLMHLPELELEPSPARGDPETAADVPAEAPSTEAAAALDEPAETVADDGLKDLEFEPPKYQGEATAAAMDPDVASDFGPVEIVPTSLAPEHEEDVEEVETADAAEELEIVHEFSAEADVEELDVDELDVDVGLEIEGAIVADDWPEKAEAPEEPREPAVDRVALLRDRIEEEGPEPELVVELAEALLESGDRDEATQLLRRAVQLYGGEEDYRAATRVLDELLQLDINDLSAHQKRSEFALKMGNRPGIIEAYLDLADCLDRTDAGNKAETVYARVLELDPGNRRALAALEMAGSTSSPPEQVRAETDGTAASDDLVDLGSLVLDEANGPKTTRFTISASEVLDEDEVDFSEMLDQFKSKVAEAIEEEDSASHYDLGVAYKEMGLVDEAIAEFQIAARGPDYRLRALEMLGACFLEKDDYRIAIKVLSRAIQAPDCKDEDLLGIFYAMGRAHEGLSENQKALEWYERVMGCDINFADAAQRVSSLRG